MIQSLCGTSPKALALGSGVTKVTNLKITFGFEDARHRELCIPEKRHEHSQERVILLQKTKKPFL